MGYSFALIEGAKGGLRAVDFPDETAKLSLRKCSRSKINAMSFDAGLSVRARLQIGDCWADGTTNELTRAGETVRIEPKAMEVLMVLAARPGQVVSREELLSTVWSGVVVGDEALTQCIIKLRRALGDNPRSPSYIETISKRGYRLIAAVGKDEPLPPPRHARRSLRSLALVAGIVFILLGAGIYFWRSLQPAVIPADAFGVGGGEEYNPALVTVTVYPFETLASGPEQAYLARGISSDLMTDLSRLSGLRVISPPSGPPVSKTPTTAHYIVTGSLQREAAMLRLNVRLIDSRTGEQLWSQRLERPFGDLFEIQNEISRRLSEELPTKITRAERQRLAKRYTSNVEAYDYFLRGQALFLVRRSEENRQARALYAKAVELDPKFARAYAGLAMTYAMEYRYLSPGESSTAFSRALELAETARLMDPSIPEVHWALGFVHTQRARHGEALKSLQKAIELNRSYADAYALMAGVYTYLGQPAESIRLLRTALRLNPDGGYLYFLILGRAYLFENDIEQALINLREAHARNPDDIEARLYLAAALVADGKIPAAEWEAEQMRAREASFSARSWLETYPLSSTRHKERLLELLAKVGL